MLNQKIASMGREEGREKGKEGLSVEYICTHPPASAGVLFQLDPG
jgi:hypothetical protein